MIIYKHTIRISFKTVVFLIPSIHLVSIYCQSKLNRLIGLIFVKQSLQECNMNIVALLFQSGLYGTRLDVYVVVFL